MEVHQANLTIQVHPVPANIKMEAPAAVLNTKMVAVLVVAVNIKMVAAVTQALLNTSLAVNISHHPPQVVTNTKIGQRMEAQVTSTKTDIKKGVPVTSIKTGLKMDTLAAVISIRSDQKMDILVVVTSIKRDPKMGILVAVISIKRDLKMENTSQSPVAVVTPVVTNINTHVNPRKALLKENLKK